ncbi:MAG: CoA transferase, partial [Alphaproteobacteria bacterium]|nr:CoA transferase [Alphaproteobacteria bacterium]MDX5369977.1 CoA transferase [Alphaproteobacteria bacterium]MDX5464555.1 CoA transferase [Alphaproteobacteria bacterium]
WADDPRFRTFKDRLANRDLVTEILDAALMQKTTDEWTKILGGAVPAAPVYDVAQALENPFVAERGGVADFARRAGEAGPPVRMLTGPVRVGGAEVPARAAPALGCDTADVLSTIGLGPDDIARLRADGVI